MKKMFLMAIVAAMAVSVSFGSDLMKVTGRRASFDCPKQDCYFDKCVAENCSNIKEAAKEIECIDECVNKTLQIDCDSN